MIWLNIKTLENLLISNGLSDKAGAKYLFSLVVFFVLASFLPELSTHYPSYWWDLLEAILVVLITGWGISRTFKVNRSGANRAFLKRFLSLAFVNGIRILISAAIIYLFYKIIIPLSYFYFFDNFLENQYSQLFFHPSHLAPLLPAEDQVL